MAGWTNAQEKAILENRFGGVALTAAPTTYYVALMLVESDDDGNGGTEVTAGGYARVAVTNDGTEFNTAVTGDPTQLTNKNDITFPAATAAWGTPLGYELRDALTVGTKFWGDAFTTPVAIGSGKTFYIPAGTMKLELGHSTDTYSS